MTSIQMVEKLLLQRYSFCAFVRPITSVSAEELSCVHRGVDDGGDDESARVDGRHQVEGLSGKLRFETQ
jgi:hypothetical protein